MRWLISVLLLLLLSSIAYAQIYVEASGICRDFDVTITTNLSGCYDVKIDADGRIMHGDEWKSTFFYIDNALCGSAKFKIHLDSDKNVTAVAKLRQNETVIQQQFDIIQNCPDTTEEFFAAITAIISLLLILIIWYTKRK